ncbi:MAG: WD40/YVTN/BNR-like repeat-containing protein, partial [Candidatus Binatia bacterium]
ALAMQDPIFYDIRFVDAQNGWIVGEFGRLLKTVDGGQTWTEHQDTLMTDETGIVDPMDIPTFFGAHLISGTEAYAAGLDGKIAVTRNAGEVWTFEPMELEFPIIDPLYEATMTPDGTGWAVGAAGEVVTRKAGESAWKRADLGMAIYTWIRSIDFADAQNGWLVGGYGTILRTEDGGKSWRLCLG